MQAVDQTEVRGTIQLEHPHGRLLLVDEHNWTPVALRKFRVDALDLFIGMLLQRLVGRKLAAGWRRNLQQTDSAEVPGIVIQQRLQRVEALDDALGEIPALDPQADDHVGRDLIAFAHRCAAGCDIRQVRQPARRPLDGDRIRGHPADAALQRHRHVLAVDLALEKAIHRVEKILAVIARVKTQNVGRQHMRQHLALPGTHTESLGVRPGDMPEQGDRRAGNFFANQQRQQRKMKILDENDRGRGGRFRRDDLRELGVDLFVCAPVAGAKRRPDIGQMTQRP